MGKKALSARLRRIFFKKRGKRNIFLWFKDHDQLKIEARLTKKSMFVTFHNLITMGRECKQANHELQLARNPKKITPKPWDVPMMAFVLSRKERITFTISPEDHSMLQEEAAKQNKSIVQVTHEFLAYGLICKLEGHASTIQLQKQNRELYHMLNSPQPQKERGRFLRASGNQKKP